MAKAAYGTVFNGLLDLYFPTLIEMERWLVFAALMRTDYHKDAAHLLGVSPRVMSYKLNFIHRPFWRAWADSGNSVE